MKLRIKVNDIQFLEDWYCSSADHFVASQVLKSFYNQDKLPLLKRVKYSLSSNIWYVSKCLSFLYCHNNNNGNNTKKWSTDNWYKLLLIKTPQVPLENSLFTTVTTTAVSYLQSRLQLRQWIRTSVIATFLGMSNDAIWHEFDLLKVIKTANTILDKTSKNFKLIYNITNKQIAQIKSQHFLLMFHLNVLILFFYQWSALGDTPESACFVSPFFF